MEVVETTGASALRLRTACVVCRDIGGSIGLKGLEKKRMSEEEPRRKGKSIYSALAEPPGGVIACCGQTAPKLEAWRTPENFKGNVAGAIEGFSRKCFQNIVGSKKKLRRHTVVQHTAFPGIPLVLGTVHSSM